MSERDHGGRYALQKHIAHIEKTRERHGRLAKELPFSGRHLRDAAEALDHADGHAQQGAVTESRKRANEAGKHLDLAEKAASRMAGFAPTAITPRPRPKG